MFRMLASGEKSTQRDVKLMDGRLVMRQSA